MCAMYFPDSGSNVDMMAPLRRESTGGNESVEAGGESQRGGDRGWNGSRQGAAAEPAVDSDGGASVLVQGR
jgi:hypothetical protein